MIDPTPSNKFADCMFVTKRDRRGWKERGGRREKEREREMTDEARVS